MPHLIYGDISYVHQRHDEINTLIGFASVGNEDDQLLLTMDRFGMSGREGAGATPEQAAEKLWTESVKQAGIDYE